MPGAQAFRSRVLQSRYLGFRGSVTWQHYTTFRGFSLTLGLRSRDAAAIADEFHDKKRTFPTQAPPTAMQGVIGVRTQD